MKSSGHISPRLLVIASSTAFAAAFAIAFVPSASATQILSSLRSVEYSRIDGVSVSATAPIFGQSMDFSSFNDTASYTYQDPSRGEITLTSRGSIYHRSSIDLNEHGGIDLYAMLGALSDTDSGFGLPAAGASGTMRVLVRFDTPQRFDLTMDAQAGGDEASTIVSLLNGRYTMNAIGPLGLAVVSADESEFPVWFGENSWQNFRAGSPDSFPDGAGIVYLPGPDPEPSELAYTGILEPGEYAFDFDLNGPADGEDAFVSMAAFVDFSSRAIFDQPGDANRDETVDQADLDAVLNHWGSAAAVRATGDLDGDGVVAQGDLDAVLNHWGTAATPNLSRPTTAIPEPAAATLLALAGTLTRRRRG